METPIYIIFKHRGKSSRQFPLNWSDLRIAPPLTLEKISSGDVEKRAGALEAGRALEKWGVKWLTSWISSRVPKKVETFVGEMSKTPLTPNLVRLSLLDFLFCVLIADLSFDFWHFVLFYHKTSGQSGSNNELSITETWFGTCWDEVTHRDIVAAKNLGDLFF